MAKRSSKKKASRRGRGGPKPDFHRQTVLFQWALAKFGVASLREFAERFQVGPDDAGGLNEQTARHHFFERIAASLPATTGDVLAVDRLEAYEQNILEHTQAINTARLHQSEPKIDWKYHQYLALLLTEMFLDRYFADPDGLRHELNVRIAEHNDEPSRIDGDKVEPFDESESARDQLARLAFWCATGSGKTLLMHVHIRQFRQYHRRAFDAGRWPKLDQIILVTPNAGLSRQHARELAFSGFDTVAVGEQGVEGLFAEQAKQAIKILDIHKFRDEHGKATVATESFEGCNLVLVDEGHRGAGRGEEGAWLTRRDQLARGGFCIEYSATFKEAVQGDEGMRNRYARSILFDYAYRSFYRDGYGKDFTILNLEDDDKQRRYLTASLLLFYQQMRVWIDGGDAIKPFRIDKPLWVFVGHTVVGKTKTVDDKESVSDVVEVLLFLRRFLAERTESIELIQSLLEEGFADSNGRNLLARRLPHIDDSGDKEALARALHAGILRDVFNAPEGGALGVQLFRRAEGELALLVGEEIFGVVNVGDPGAVANACEENGVTRREDDEYRDSLFHGINRDDSPVNLLVGSRKFTEGWNSWRVSSIGLMRMGKSEGTQIIQLFGRGVRLRGYRMSLRRSSVLAEKPTPPRNLRQVETLQVFGVKASYMNTFRDWIFSEVPEAQEKEVWDLPVVQTLPKRKLRTLKLRDEIDGVKVERGQAFRKLGPLVVLRPPHEADPADAWLRRHPTRLNWLPRVRGLVGESKQVTATIGESTDKPDQKFTDLHIAMLDIDELLFGLEAFKATRGLDRLHANRESIRMLLRNRDWYHLLATTDDMRTDRWENRAQWHRMAQQLINAYAERFYRYIRGRWEAPYIEVAEIVEDDPNLVDGHTIESTELAETAEDIERIAGIVEELRTALKSDPLVARTWFAGKWKTVPFAGHLYQPLMYVGKRAQIKISPVALDKHEAQFVTDLATWCTSHSDRDVYLLRNQAVSGLGFFQASNFFPDFLLWVEDGDREHLAFVDPKGLHHFDPSDPKVQFATQEIPRLQEIVNRQAEGLVLHAFLISNTLYRDLPWSTDAGTTRLPKEAVEAIGVWFQKDDPTTYIDSMMSAITSPAPAAT